MSPRQQLSHSADVVVDFTVSLPIYVSFGRACLLVEVNF